MEGKPECYIPNKKLSHLCKGDELALHLGKCKDCDLYEDETVKIVEIIPNDGVPDKFSYKYFAVVLSNGTEKTFHYHINNPMPAPEEMIGLTWEELCSLCAKMFRDAISTPRRKSE